MKNSSLRTTFSALLLGFAIVASPTLALADEDKSEVHEVKDRIQEERHDIALPEYLLIGGASAVAIGLAFFAGRRTRKPK